MFCSKNLNAKKKSQSALFEVLEPRQLFSGYTVVDLGLGIARGINDKGEVVGNIPDAFGNGGNDAAYWSASGTLYDLNWGGDNGDAYAINNSGEVVGWANHVADGGQHAFRLDTTSSFKVGGTDFTYGDDTVAGEDTFYAIDNSFIGLSVGISNNVSETGAFYNGQFYSVPGLPGEEGSTIPFGVSDFNSTTGNTAIVGYSDQDAFYNSGGTTVDISELLGATQSNGFAWGVNASADCVVGQNAGKPFAYYPGSNFAEYLSSAAGSARAVNNSGNIVGSFETGGNTDAFVDSGNGLQDLNNLLPVNSGWHLAFATGINSSGEICGYGTYEGAQHAFTLTPDTQGALADIYNAPTTITSATSQPATFNIDYHEAFAIQLSDVNASDFTISGPSGKTATITLDSLTANSSDSEIYAGFSITAPGGSWDHSDNGTYTVSLNADTVGDSVGNFNAGQTLFSFNVNVPIPATAPTVSSLTSSSSSVLQGSSVALTANGVADVNNNLSSVSFYRESNGKAGLQTGTGGDVLVSTDTSSSGGWTASASTTGLAAGTYTFYAEAKDTTNLLSNIVSKTVTVLQTGSISGTVFNDANGNGTRDSSDAALSGWRVYLDTNKDGTWQTTEKSIVTTSTGAFNFSGLALGTYRVREVSQSGWRLTTPSAGYYDITLTSTAANVTAKLFGDTKSVSVSGNVFSDANSNGKKDSTEKGLSGWTVYLDTNNNGKLDSGEKSVKTDANGNFSFTGLAAGTYIIRIVQFSSSDKLTTPASGNYLETLSSGSVFSNVLFGEHV